MSQLKRSLTILLLLAAIAGLQAAMDAVRPERDPAAELVYLPNAEVAQVLASGHSETVADLLFIKGINYLLANIDKDPNPLYLKRVFETLVALDPDGVRFYDMGALLLSSIAERHQAAMDLYAHADGRRYTVEAMGSLRFDGEDEPVPSRASWLDFRRRLMRPGTTPGQLHPKNPKAWLLHRSRATTMILNLRDYRSAGRELLEASKHSEVDEASRATWAALGQQFMESGSKNARKQLEGQRGMLEAEIASATREAVRKSHERRLAAVEAELAEMDLNALAARLREVGHEVSRWSDLEPALRPAQARGQAPKDPYGEGFVVMGSGRIVSRGRVKAEAREVVERALRRYQESHERAFPPSLEAAGLNPEDLPPLARVAYDSATGEFSISLEEP